MRRILQVKYLDYDRTHHAAQPTAGFRSGSTVVFVGIMFYEAVLMSLESTMEAQSCQLAFEACYDAHVR